MTTNGGRTRTSEEIKAITKLAGDMIWIQNMQTEGDHDFVDALFAHSDSYSLTVIASAVIIARDLHGEYREDMLTTDFLERVETVSTGLHALIVEGACHKWNPDEFKKLVRQFTSEPGDWDLAMEVIRSRNINKYDHLMGLLEEIKRSNVPPVREGLL